MARRMHQQSSRSLFAIEQLRVLQRPVMHRSYSCRLHQKQSDRKQCTFVKLLGKEVAASPFGSIHMEYVADILILMTLANRATRKLNRPPVGLMSVSRTPKVMRIMRSSRYCTAAVVIIDDGMHMQTSTATLDSKLQQALNASNSPGVAYRYATL